VQAAGRSLVMLVATGAAIFFYQRSQDIGGLAYDHFFPASPEISDLKADLFLTTYWLILPAALASLAVGVPAVRLRLSPRTTIVWSTLVPVAAMFTRFPFGPDSHGLLELYLMSLAPVLPLAWVLGRYRKASRFRGAYDKVGAAQ
jgi:hypothetical protein